MLDPRPLHPNVGVGQQQRRAPNERDPRPLTGAPGDPAGGAVVARSPLAGGGAPRAGGGPRDGGAGGGGDAFLGMKRGPEASPKALEPLVAEEERANALRRKREPALGHKRTLAAGGAAGDMARAPAAVQIEDSEGGVPKARPKRHAEIFGFGTFDEQIQAGYGGPGVDAWNQARFYNEAMGVFGINLLAHPPGGLLQYKYDLHRGGVLDLLRDYTDVVKWVDENGYQGNRSWMLEAEPDRRVHLYHSIWGHVGGASEAAAAAVLKAEAEKWRAMYDAVRDDAAMAPTHHMYYADRIMDVPDHLPKYVKSAGRQAELWRGD